jgi:hypothetical protein
MEAKPIGVTDAVPEDHGGDEVAFALRQARQAKTLLGRQLWEIRARIIASGVPLFSWDEIDQEVAERRGGAHQDDGGGSRCSPR